MKKIDIRVLENQLLNVEQQIERRNIQLFENQRSNINIINSDSFDDSLDIKYRNIKEKLRIAKLNLKRGNYG